MIREFLFYKVVPVLLALAGLLFALTLAAQIYTLIRGPQ